MVAYPTDVPAPTRGAFVENALGGTATDPNDMGVFNSRNLTTKILRTFEYSVELNDAERASLLSFYDVDVLRSGSFDFTHPITAEVIVCRFESRPVISNQGYQWHVGKVKLMEV